jgi:hypothetical protein
MHFDLKRGIIITTVLTVLTPLLVLKLKDEQVKNAFSSLIFNTTNY